MWFGVSGLLSDTWLQVLADSSWRESGEKIEYGEGRSIDGALAPNVGKEKRKRMHYVGIRNGYSRRKANY